MIYDCFMFFNELELLELRLHELSGVVDKFVLVETTRTFSNKPKSLIFQENRSRFKEFQDKIIHVVVDDMPRSNNAWALELFQRNAICRGLENCRPDDIVLVSDVDEIPRATTLVEAVGAMKYHRDPISNFLHGALNSRAALRLFRCKGFRRIARKGNPFVYGFEQEQYWHFMNCQRLDAFKYGTKMAFFRDFPGGEEMRYSGYKIIKNGGWHFSYMGGAERIREKIMAYSHQERNRPEITDLNSINDRINRAAPLWNLDCEFRFVPLDDGFPKYLLTHREAFASWIKPLENQPTVVS
jgi:beta-1,4-mannosyl-glycoprotein beta-1,4-N-acetylglucosaminyltransferase